MSQPAVIEEFTAEQMEALAKTIGEWDALVISTERINHDEVARAVAAVYAESGSGAPDIVYCESPRQIASKLRDAGPLIFSMELDKRFSEACKDFTSERDLVFSSRRGQRVVAQLDSAKHVLYRQLVSPFLRQLQREVPGQSVTGAFHLWLLAYLYALADVDKFANELPAGKSLGPWLTLTKATPGFIAFEKICFVCDRPTTINFDESGSVHSDNGPAIEFSDGYALFQ